MKFSLFILLAFGARGPIDAATQHGRRLRTQVYPEDELAEDTLSSVFNVFQVEMSMATPSPSNAPSKAPGEFPFLSVFSFNFIKKRWIYPHDCHTLLTLSRSTFDRNFVTSRIKW